MSRETHSRKANQASLLECIQKRRSDEEAEDRKEPSRQTCPCCFTVASRQVVCRRFGENASSLITDAHKATAQPQLLLRFADFFLLLKVIHTIFVCMQLLPRKLNQSNCRAPAHRFKTDFRYSLLWASSMFA